MTRPCIYCPKILTARSKGPECYRCRNNIKSRDRKAFQKMVGTLVGEHVARAVRASV